MASGQNCSDAPPRIPLYTWAGTTPCNKGVTDVKRPPIPVLWSDQISVSVRVNYTEQEMK